MTTFRWYHLPGRTPLNFMYITRQKEEFSIAYAHAIAAVAGFALETFRVDNDSADVTIRSDLKYSVLDNPRVELQLKCSAVLVAKKGQFAFDLPANNYKALCSTRRHVPLFLVVIHVPVQSARWMSQQNRRTALLRHCAYWADLRGFSPTNNSRSVTIRIPHSQLFDHRILRTWMTRTGKGDFL